jgi:hypothetical protein
MFFLDALGMHLRSWSAAANNVARWRIVVTAFESIGSGRICNFDVFESDMVGVPVDVVGTTVCANGISLLCQ